MKWCSLLKVIRWLFWLGLLRWEEHELVPVGCGRCWWVLLWLVVGKEELGIRGCWSWRCRTAGSSGAGV